MTCHDTPRRRRSKAKLLSRSALAGVLAGGGLLPGLADALPVLATMAPQVAGGAAQAPVISTSGSTATVNTNAARTLIDWSSYTVANGEAVNYTVATRSDIVLNRLDTTNAVQINGVINSYVGSTGGAIGGNIWFSAPGGVIFGSTAVVNVGGLLATTAVLDQTQFLDTSTSSFPFSFPSTGSGYPIFYPGITGFPTSNTAGGFGGVSVASGAQLTAHGGLMALIAPFVNVASGATVQSLDETVGTGGAGSVLYGAADAFTVSLSQETSGDLDMLQFIVNSPSSVTDNPLLLQGATTATNVYVASLSASGITGAVVDATGALTANTASAGQGGEIILTTGADTVTAPSFANGVFTPGTASNQNGATFSPSGLRIGSMTAGEDIQATSSGSLNGAASTGFAVMAGGDVTLNAQGDLSLNGVSSMNGQINLTGGAVTVGAITANGGVVNQPPTSVAGDLTVNVIEGSFTYTNPLIAGGSISITAFSGLTLGDVTARNGTLTLEGEYGSISAGNLAAGGDISASTVYGSPVSLISATAGGGISIISNYLQVASTLAAKGGDLVISARDTDGNDQNITLSGAASASGNVQIIFTGHNDDGSLYGAGPISVTSLTAGGAIQLDAATIAATSLTAKGTDAAGDSVVVSALPNPTDPNIDIGAITAAGSASLTANKGYLSLTSATFTSPGQTLSLTTTGAHPLYLGYTGVGAYLAGGAAPVGGQGGVTGAGTITLASGGDVNVDVNTGVALKSVSAGGGVDLASAADLSLTSDLNTAGDVKVSAPGLITLANVTSTGGSVTLTGAGGVSFGSGQAADDFTATAITGTPGSGSGPGTGTGAINAGSVNANNGSSDLEGTNVSVGAVGAGGEGANANANGYAIYLAAWGGPGTSRGRLSYGALSPAYDVGQDFLYPTPPALPVQDTSAPFQFDTNGSAPTIGTPTLLGNGNTGETVTLNARRTLIDWTSYTIGAGGEVDYVFNPAGGQNAANARGDIVLNRITGGAPVDIEGVLTSTVAGDTQAYGGNVWFSAPGGVVFGSGAVVNVGGLLATTAGFSQANLTSQFLNPSVLSFNLDGAGTGYPSGATGFPGGSGYPGGAGYPNQSPLQGDVGVAVEGGARINATGSFIGLIGPYVDVAAGATLANTDHDGLGSDSILYAAAPSYALTLAQPALGGDPVNGPGDTAFTSLAIGTSDLSGYATPLDIEGQTETSNVYAAALSPATVAGATSNLTGPIDTPLYTVQAAGGDMILSTAADTIAARTPVSPSPAPYGAETLQLGDIRDHQGNLQILTSGGLQDLTGYVFAEQNLTITAAGDVAIGDALQAGGAYQNGNLTVSAISAGGAGPGSGVGAISLNDAVAIGGTLTLQGSSITAGQLSASTEADLVGPRQIVGGPSGVTANAYGAASGAPGSIDIASILTDGNISLTSNGGYASLTGVTFTNFTSPSQTLAIQSTSAPIYLGYASGGPGANGGAGPTPFSGSISGTGVVNLSTTTSGDVDAALTGPATFGTVSAQGAANLTADAITANDVEATAGSTLTANLGDLNLGQVDNGYTGLTALYAPKGNVTVSQMMNGVGVTIEAAGSVNANEIDGEIHNAVIAYNTTDNVSVTGASVTIGAAVPFGDVTVTATNGAASLGFSSGLGSTTVSAANGSASVGSANVFPGGLSTASLSVSATGANGDALLGSGASSTVSGFASVTLAAARDVTVDVGTALELNSVQAGHMVSLTAPALTLDALSGALAGDIDITTTQAGFTFNADLTAGGGVNVAASGALQLGGVTAGGAAALRALDSIQAGQIQAGDTIEVFAGVEPTLGGAYDPSAAVNLGALTAAGSILVTAPGAISIASLSTSAGGTNSIDVAGLVIPALDGSGSYTTPVPTSIITGAANTAGGINLNAQASIQTEALTGGGPVTVYTSPEAGSAGPFFVDVASAQSTGGGTITLNAGQGYASLGSATFTQGGTLSISTQKTGAPIYLGYAQGGQQAGGGTGSITGAPTVELSSEGGVYVDVTGAANLDSVMAYGPISLIADSVSANSVFSFADNLNPPADGTTTVLARTGDASFFDIQSYYGPLSISAPMGNVTVGDDASGMGVAINAAGLANIAYTSSVGYSGDDLLYTSNPVSITAGQVILGQANVLEASNSYGGYLITATNGDATVGDIHVGGGPVMISATNGTATLHGVNLIGSDGFPTLSNGYPTPVASPVSVTASGANGDVVIGGADGQGSIVGASSLTAQASRDLTVQVAGALGLDTATAGRNASVTADQLTLGALTAGHDVTLTTPNPATSQLAVTPTLTANSVSAGEDLTITAGDVLTLGSLSVGRNLSITAPSVSLASLTDQPSGSILVDATGGGFTDASTLSAPGGVSVTAAGPLSLADVTSSQGAVTLTGSSVTTGRVTAGTIAQATSESGNLQLGPVMAGGDITLASTDGFITSPSLSAGGGILADVYFLTYSSTNSVPPSLYANIGSATSGGDMRIVAASYVEVGSAVSGGDIDLIAPEGYVSLTNATLQGGSLSLNAYNGGNASLANATFLEPGGMLSLNAYGGGNVYLGCTPGSQVLGGGGTVTGAPQIDLYAEVGAVNVNLTGAAALDQVESDGGPITITADAITANGVFGFGGTPDQPAGGAVTLLARTGDISASDVQSTNGPVVVTSTEGSATIGFLAGQGINVTAANTVNINYASEIYYATDASGATVRVGQSFAPITLTGSEVSLGLANSYGGDVITATDGDAMVGDIHFGGGAVVVQATNGTASLHSASLLGSPSDVPPGDEFGPVEGGAVFLTPMPSTITVSAAGAGGNVIVGGASQPVFLETGTDTHQIGGQGLGFITDATSVTLQASQDVTANLAQPVELNSVQAGRDVSLSGDALQVASLSSGRNTVLTGAGPNITEGQVGGDLTVSSSADATLGSITVGGALALDAAGLASLGSVSVKGPGRITAGDLNIATLVSSPSLTLEAANGGLTVGGTTAPADGSMWISEAEFGRLRASNSLALYAGSTAGTARGALTVSDLSLDPTVTPKVSLYAGAGQTVSVTGAVTPTTSGGTLAIGSTTDASWTPSTILVSGALGAATRVSDTSFTGVQAFSQVTLSSGGDVLIGSPRFFALVQASPAKDINIGLDQPSGATATGSEIGKVYVTAGQLNIDAAGKVVQQNSSGSATSYAGLYLLNGVSASKTALSLDPPSVVELFGSFVDASGVLTSGAEASRSTGLQLLDQPAGSQTPDDYRFNGCEISVSAACGIMVGPEQGFLFQPPDSQQYSAVAAATTNPKVLTQSVLLTIPPSTQIEEQVDPVVTGVGNEEIWRKRLPMSSGGSDR